MLNGQGLGRRSGRPTDIDASYAERCILVTLDKDFGEQAAACIEALEDYGDELQQGSIVVAEPGKIKCRRPRPILH